MMNRWKCSVLFMIFHKIFAWFWCLLHKIPVRQRFCSRFSITVAIAVKLLMLTTTKHLLIHTNLVFYFNLYDNKKVVTCLRTQSNTAATDAIPNMKMCDMWSSLMEEAKSQKAGKTLLRLHSSLTSIPARSFFIPQCFNLCFSSFVFGFPLFLLPHFLHTPVSASLRSLCSPLGVADDRRLGGSKLRHWLWRCFTDSLLWCFR